MPGRVFIVGAGASRYDSTKLNPPLPLASEFFSTPYINAHWHWTSIGVPFEKSALAKILKHFFGVSWSKRAGKLELKPPVNVEEVYSFIETCLQVYPTEVFNDRETFAQARKELLKYIVDVIRYVPWTLERPKLHSAIVRCLEARDSIITFNWDLLCDQVLGKTGKGRRYLESQAELLNPFKAIGDHQDNYEDHALVDLHKGQFLKMHGSVNLAACQKSNCILASIPYRFGLKDESLEYWPCRACGSPLEVMIIPPYVHKSYLGTRFSGVQASIAATKISMAEEITIIGYSMPIFDFQARTLMRLARLRLFEIRYTATNLDHLIIVNPQTKDPTYVQNVRELFGLDRMTKVYGRRIRVSLYDNVDAYLDEQLLAKRKKPTRRKIRVHAKKR